MKHGPLIFLGLLFALSLSWLGMVATPQLQLGNQQPTNMQTFNLTYPIPRSGLASVGRDVYRANGCAYCHTQVIRQEGNRFDLVLANSGTNQTAVAEVLIGLKRDLDPAAVQRLIASAPVSIMTDSVKSKLDGAQKALAAAGAEANVRVVPTGPDIERGWGSRLSVAHDYLYDNPVLLGSVRLGPDLTNVGTRRPDAIWHLVHLFDPKLQVPGSTMPRYPFLFEKRTPGRQRSPDALPISGAQEIVPTPEARALAAYLTSLNVEMPLFEAPGPQIPAPPPAAGNTNQPGAAAGPTTNAPAPGAPVQSPAPNQAAPQ
jgi:cbb3-type cytochrome oxidase cytochrome c subunit